MDSVLMRNPATGATQELQARETVRRTILLAAGWVEVANVAVRIDDDLVVLDDAPSPKRKRSQ